MDRAWPTLATDTRAEWNTWMVPVLGGEPEELLPNAAALTWTDPEQVLFSEIKTGHHMGIVTRTESRAGERDVYLPADLVAWRTTPGYLLMASGFWCRKWTGSGGPMPRASFRWEQQRRDSR
jgi:hypothetical protein